MINYLYRIIIKIHTIFKNIYHKAYIEVCKSRGLKLGKGVILIDTPDFGSEPYLLLTMGQCMLSEVWKNTKMLGILGE